MSRTRKAKHKPRCGLCHPNKLDGNSMKNANRAEPLRRQRVPDHVAACEETFPSWVETLDVWP